MYAISRPLPRFLLGILFMPVHAVRAGRKRDVPTLPLPYRSVTGSRPAASA